MYSWQFSKNVLTPKIVAIFAKNAKTQFYCDNTSYPMEIAYPVGADRPAKRQKKTPCVSTGLPVRSTSALARWRVVLPSCLDSVTSWHLFCLARTSAHGICFLCQFFLWILARLLKIVILKLFYLIDRHL